MKECQPNTGLNIGINGEVYNGNVDTGYNLKDIDNLQEEITELQECCETVQTDIDKIEAQINTWKSSGMPTYTSNADMTNLASANGYINWMNFSPSHNDIVQTNTYTFTINSPGLYVTSINRILSTAIGNSITFETVRPVVGSVDYTLPNANGVFEIGIPVGQTPATLKVKTEAAMTAAMGGYLIIQKVRDWA